MKALGKVFATGDAYLDAVTLGHLGDDGGHAGGDEVHIPGHFAETEEFGPNGEWNWLRERQDTSPVRGRQRFEKQICKRMRQSGVPMLGKFARESRSRAAR
jgi:hypothetical protein